MFLRKLPRHTDAVLLSFFMLALPFGALYWLVPLFSSLTIGNDYAVFPIQHQLELIYSQYTGTFPLYVPGFAEGRSQAALTLGQMYHPLPYFASLFSGYGEGHALQINTMLRLFSLGMAQTFLFFLFRALTLTRIAAFLVSFITVYNLRMLDCFRYGASLENYTAFLFLFAALGLVWLKPRHYSGPVAVAISTWLLCCGGHPQMMHLGFLGAAISCALIPFAFSAFTCEPTPKLRPIAFYYASCGIAVVVGILLSAAYLASFYAEFVAENTKRVGQAYEWSLAYTDTAGGLLNNFFAPLSSDVHGAFGSSPLILLPFFILLLPALRVLPHPAILAFAVLSAITVIISAGKATPLHRLFWEYVPLADAFRVPGRITMILPVLLALPLAWLLRPVESIQTFFRRTLPLSPLFLPALCALGAFLFYHFHLSETLPPPSHYHPNQIGALPPWLEPAIFRVGLVALVVALLYSIRIPWRPGLFRIGFGLLLIAATAAQGFLQLRHGTWVVTDRPSKTFEQFQTEKQNDPAFIGAPGFGMESPAVTAHMEHSAFDRRLARFYREAMVATDSEHAYRRMARDRHPHAAVVEGLPQPIVPGDKTTGKPDKVELVHSTFNRFVFDITTGAKGVLAFSLPHDGRWRAFRDGVATEVYRANGIENAVPLEAGSHRVEFRYGSPTTITGAWVATAALCLLLCYFAYRAFRGKTRLIAAGLMILSSLTTLLAWHRSLEAGDSLNTAYVWTSDQLPPRGNLAFGRPTRMSSIRSVQMPYFYYSGFATDGGRTGRPFLTRTERSRPWWQVDLGRRREIGRIHIYDRNTGHGHLPLHILVSDDGVRFRLHQQVAERPRGNPWSIEIAPIRTRFVRLQSGRPGALSYAEVEIYAPVRVEPPAPTAETPPVADGEQE